MALAANKFRVCWWALFLHSTMAVEVPCYFIFGDSLVDNGNNNQIRNSNYRANYQPYGVDFPNGPSGRFSNGKTTVDVLAELLGFDNYIPSYEDASGQEVLKGVNYASAAAGIREETGKQLGGRISFSGQVKNYIDTVSEIVRLEGDEDSAARYLSKCIYSVGIGSNDYLNNYFMPTYYNTANQYTPQQYAEDLIERYTDQLKILYKYGARKFVLNGIGQLGCSPSVLLRNSVNGRTCVKSVNNAVKIFNKKLRALVDRLNDKTPDARLTYIDTYGIFKDLIDNPRDHGFDVGDKACCGVGRNEGYFTCLPYQTPCQDRNQYLYWDAFHPTEAVNTYVGKRAFDAQSSDDAYPYDIHHLAELEI
ncbi:GDSL esterase/lipase At1g29670 [Linum grandiflorum]